MTRNISQPSSDLLSEAAHWYNDRLSGDMTPDDEASFNEWLVRSPAHTKAYFTVDRGWTIAGAISPNRETLLERDVEAVASYPEAKRPRWKIAIAMVASLFLGITLSVGVWPQFANNDRIAAVQNFETTTGQKSLITLPDGTQVTMDAETEMRFRDLKGERRVEMVRGRAYFDVAKNLERPFIVHVDGKTVKALGTKFEVSMNGDVVAVVLTEGKVRVEDSKRNGSAELAPGRQLVIRADRQWTLRNIDVRKETSWTDGRLIFLGDPLAQAISEVNRYSSKKIVFEDGRVPDREIVGIFSAGDVEGFVTALELNEIAHKVSTSHNAVVLSSLPLAVD